MKSTNNTLIEIDDKLATELELHCAKHDINFREFCNEAISEKMKQHENNFFENMKVYGTPIAIFLVGFLFLSTTYSTRFTPVDSTYIDSVYELNCANECKNLGGTEFYGYKDTYDRSKDICECLIYKVIEID